MINKVILMGRLTADPELKTTTSGVSVISFAIAVDRSYTDSSGNRQTDFINCVAWRQTAEFITKYFRKGSMIAVVGSIQQRSYTDKDGNKRYAFEVLVEQTSFCGSKAESKTVDESVANADTSGFEDYAMDDGDLPF